MKLNSCKYVFQQPREIRLKGPSCMLNCRIPSVDCYCHAYRTPDTSLYGQLAYYLNKVVKMDGSECFSYC